MSIEDLVPIRSEIGDALDDLGTARRHLELIEKATRTDAGDSGPAINAVAWAALHRIMQAQRRLEAAQRLPLDGNISWGATA